MGDAFLDAFVRVLIVLGSSGGLRSGNIPDILFNHARRHQLLIDEQVALIALHAASSLLRRVALLAGLLARALVVVHQADSLDDGTVVRDVSVDGSLISRAVDWVARRRNPDSTSRPRPPAGSIAHRMLILWNRKQYPLT